MNERAESFHIKLVNCSYLKSNAYREFIQELKRNKSVTRPLFLYNPNKDEICLLAFNYIDEKNTNIRPLWLDINDENIEHINCFVKSLSPCPEVCLLPFEKIRILRKIEVKDSDNKELWFCYARAFSDQYRMLTEVDRHKEHNYWRPKITEESEFPYDKLDYDLIYQITSRFGPPKKVSSEIMAASTELRNLVMKKGSYPHGIVHIRIIPTMLTPQGKPTYMPMGEVKLDLDVKFKSFQNINEIDGSVWNMFREIGDPISQMAFNDQINRYESYESVLL